jgi:hypothetical protein
MVQADEATTEWVDQLHVPECIGQADDQRHEHDGRDQDYGGSDIQVGLKAQRKSPQGGTPWT